MQGAVEPASAGETKTQRPEEPSEVAMHGHRPSPRRRFHVDENLPPPLDRVHHLLDAEVVDREVTGAMDKAPAERRACAAWARQVPMEASEQLAGRSDQSPQACGIFAQRVAQQAAQLLAVDMVADHGRRCRRTVEDLDHASTTATAIRLGEPAGDVERDPGGVGTPPWTNLDHHEATLHAEGSQPRGPARPALHQLVVYNRPVEMGQKPGGEIGSEGP